MQPTSRPWTRKYQPKSTKEVIGQDSAVSQVRSFVKDYKKQKKKAALLYGSVGSGKTCSVYAVANELGLEVLEINASDFRNKEGIKSVVGSASRQMSLFSKGKIILVDEVDGLSGTKDRGGLPELASVIDKTGFPIIMTAVNPWNSKFSKLRRKSETIQFHTLNYLSICNNLKGICRHEKIKYDDLTLKTLARRSGGDMRAAINDLQTITSETRELKQSSLDEVGDRNRVESMLNALVKVFKTLDAGIAVTAFDNVEENLDTSFLWVDENLPKEYTDPEDLANAYDRLSMADVYRGRIRRQQHWRFLVYENTLMTSGVALAKKEKYKHFIKYQPTGRILKLWKAKMKYMKRKSIAAKIAERTHTSSSYTIKNTLPYIKAIFKKNRKQGDVLAEYFDLNNDEVGWLRK